MKVTYQKWRFLSRLKIELNYASVESSLERRFHRFVKAQKFSQQKTVILKSLYAVKQIEFLFQTVMMPKCTLFQPGQYHVDSIAVIQIRQSNLYASICRYKDNCLTRSKAMAHNHPIRGDPQEIESGRKAI
jgi:hypothetical protein